MTLMTCSGVRWAALEGDGAAPLPGGAVAPVASASGTGVKVTKHYLNSLFSSLQMNFNLIDDLYRIEITNKLIHNTTL